MNLTLSYHNVIYQILTKRAAYTMRKAQVQVRETSTGVITIEYKGRPLEHAVYRELEQQQAKVIHSKLLQPSRSRPKPAPKVSLTPSSHPWRTFAFGKNSIEAKERRGELRILRK